jgi:hypothetical protein
MCDCDELRAGAAGEVVKVDTAIHASIDSAHGCTDGVDPVHAVGVRIHDLAGALDHFTVVVSQDTHRVLHRMRLPKRTISKASIMSSSRWDGTAKHAS